VSPLGDDSSAPHGVICLFTDLTAVVALEEQVRLKDSLARVGELTAGIAHEFRNGLATIHGYSRLLNLDALPEQFRPYVEGIRAETEAMREVVTNFLNFAKPDQPTLSPVDLGAIAERAADDLRADARALSGDIHVDGEFAVIEGDDVLLRQAFSNLLRNAIEACAAASIAPLVSVEARIDRAQGINTITVADNGPGFPEHMRERVFHPFFTTKAQGTGLGLALVQKIIVTHNGRVVAGGASTGGGLITVVLPLAEDE
jgi:signal transduction histidine kinase